MTRETVKEAAVIFIWPDRRIADEMLLPKKAYEVDRTWAATATPSVCNVATKACNQSGFGELSMAIIVEQTVGAKRARGSRRMKVIAVVSAAHLNHR